MAFKWYVLCVAWYCFCPKAVSLVDVVLGIVGHRSGFFGYFLILTLGIALVSALLAALVSVFSRQLGGIVGHHKYVAGSGGEAVHTPFLTSYTLLLQGMELEVCKAWIGITR